MNYDEFKLAEKKGWSARASIYDDVTGQVTTGAIPTLLAMAETAPGKRVLDLCCGTGRTAGAAAALGAIAEGLDVSEEMIEVAKTAFPSAAFDLGDAESIPRESSSYDAVICSFGLLHVGSPETMFKEVARVLKPGGRVALSHWVAPPESPLFRIVFGTMQRFADMTGVPDSPPPFILSPVNAMQSALESVGFVHVSAVQLPLLLKAPACQFAEHFMKFSVRPAMILDQQNEDVVKKIYASWEAQLAEFLVGDEYHIPMPAIAVSATLEV